MKDVTIGGLTVGNTRGLALMAGPCALEGKDHAEMIAGRLKELAEKTGVQLIFKASFDKANRSSVLGKRGVGIDEGLKIFEGIKKTFGLPVVTDVHEPGQCAEVASVVDVLQIPAFLCRQTDLVVAAAKTGAVVNIKKGQFLAPWDMAHIAEKVSASGNERIMLTERGVSFGYNRLVTDMRGLPIMARTGYPVIMDATHSVQEPGGLGGASGGQREFAPVMARAAVSLGIAGVFIETHEQPERAPSDGANMIPLDQMEALVTSLMAFDRLAKADPLHV